MSCFTYIARVMDMRHFESFFFGIVAHSEVFANGLEDKTAFEAAAGMYKNKSNDDPKNPRADAIEHLHADQPEARAPGQRKKLEAISAAAHGVWYVRHPNRMPSLLGKARVVDDPGLDRSATLDLRQHHLTHLGQHLPVRPSPLAEKMQQRLMLRHRTRRRRDSPPSAPRSCSLPASPGPGNSRATDQPDPRGRSRSQAPRHNG
jgi:hypothetical protein